MRNRIKRNYGVYFIMRQGSDGQYHDSDWFYKQANGGKSPPSDWATPFSSKPQGGGDNGVTQPGDSQWDQAAQWGYGTGMVGGDAWGGNPPTVSGPGGSYGYTDPTNDYPTQPAPVLRGSQPTIAQNELLNWQNAGGVVNPGDVGATGGASPTNTPTTGTGGSTANHVPANDPSVTGWGPGKPIPSGWATYNNPDGTITLRPVAPGEVPGLDYADDIDKANQKSERDFNNALGAIQGGYGEARDASNNYSLAPSLSDEQRRHENVIGGQDQDLLSRGIYNSTIKNSLAQGEGRVHEYNTGQIYNADALRRMQLAENQGTAESNLWGQRSEQGPNLALQAQYLSQMGSQGGPHVSSTVNPNTGLRNSDTGEGGSADGVGTPAGYGIDPRTGQLTQNGGGGGGGGGGNGSLPASYGTLGKDANGNEVMFKPGSSPMEKKSAAERARLEQIPYGNMPADQSINSDGSGIITVDGVSGVMAGGHFTPVGSLNSGGGGEGGSMDLIYQAMDTPGEQWTDEMAQAMEDYVNGQDVTVPQDENTDEYSG